MLKYTVRPGSHFDFFLDRATMRGGKIDVLFHTEEEVDGTMAQATWQYEEEARRRMIRRVDEHLRLALPAALGFFQNLLDLEKIEGFLHPLEGFALYWLARHWPGNGYAVEIGSFKGK
ncbi:MAG: hypothetical protein ABSB74_17395 [Tepidisphaeraceae bacterium]